MTPVTDPNDIALYEGKGAPMKSVPPSSAPMAQETQAPSMPEKKPFFYMDESKYPEFQKTMKQGTGLMAAAAPAVASIFQPEIPIAGGVGMGINALARVGGGTAANTLSDVALGHVKNPEDLLNSVKENSKLNSIIEGVAHIPRAIKGVAEVFNPIGYAAKQAGKQKAAYEEAVKLQKQAYEPVMQQYGTQKLTKYPEQFLSHNKDDLRYFTPEVKKVREDFLKDPTFENLHRLQSTMGKDAAKLSNNTNKINQYQTLTAARHKLQTQAENYLQFDKAALENYRKGSELTKNEVMPFKSNPTLTKISEGTTTEIDPRAYAKAIEKGQEKKLYEAKVGGKKKNVYAIPPQHHLTNSLKSLKNRIHFGEAAQVVLPTVAGGAIGEMVDPGSTGLVSGGLSGLSAAATNALARKYAHFGVGNLVQNPLVEKMLKDYINPLYYGGARTYTGYKQ